MRVDTVGLTTALLAVLSRLHLLFSVAATGDVSKALDEVLTIRKTGAAPRNPKGALGGFQKALAVEYDSDFD